MGNDTGKVALANLALRKIGANRISSLNDRTREGDLVRDVYDAVIRECLTVHPWTFALRTKALVERDLDVLSDIHGLDTAYGYPNDCLRPHRISKRALFQIRVIGDERVILSDTLGIQMEYVYHNDNPETYIPLFYTAVATRLGAEIGFNITQASKKAQLMMQEYEEIRLPDARTADSQQGSPDEAQADEWEMGRISSGLTQEPGSSTWHSVW